MSLVRDVRYAFRALGRSPGFAVIAVLSLALGIGANTAIYTVLRASVSRPLKVTAPERLRNVIIDRGPGDVNWNTSYALFEDIRDNLPAFAGVTAHSDEMIALVTPAGAQQVHASLVSGNFFDVMGVGSATGRFFTTSDDASAVPVMVLGYDAWRTMFGGRRDAIGSTVQLNGRPFTIVGVAPKGFDGVWRGQLTTLYVPLRSGMSLLDRNDWMTRRGLSWLNVIGRLDAGASDVSLAGNLDVLTARLHADKLMADQSKLISSDASHGFTQMVADVSKPLKLLMAAVGLVVLIACANVANLLIVRARARTREIAIRLSIGATGRALARQLLVESLVLSLIAGAVGLLLANWFTEILVAYQPPSGASLALDSTPDARVLGVTLLASIVCGLLFGLAPALQAARTDLAGAMRRTDETAGGRQRWFGARGVLVAGQVALSLVLLSGAALLLRSLHNLKAIDVGYQTRTALLADIDASATRTTEAAGLAFYDELRRNAAALPGVRSVALASVINPWPGGSRDEGGRLDPSASLTASGATYDIVTVDPSYFATVQLPIVRGRAFAINEQENGGDVAVINETMAERYWPGMNPIGKWIAVDGEPNRKVVVIGVANDGKYRELREGSAATVYYPFGALHYRPSMTLVLQTEASPALQADPLRKMMRQLDAGIPVSRVRTLQDHIDTALSRDRLAANLGGLFAGFAVLLSAIGLYGVLSYAVAQRTREIGVRVALGARRADVQGMILKAAGTIVLAGIVVGIPAALAAGRLLQALLFGLQPGDPVILVSAVLMLSLTAAAAAVVPVQRALRVDPMTALRNE